MTFGVILSIVITEIVKICKLGVFCDVSFPSYRPEENHEKNDQPRENLDKLAIPFFSSKT